MKKLFVILFTICIFIIPGCKPELPGVSIYIQNSDNLDVEPASYELEILFADTDRAPGTRAFHMKNIGSDIETKGKAIVLENMPKTLYIAKVKAYDNNGKLVGQGMTDLPFMASTTSTVTVMVNEMPYATCSKKFNFPYGAIDSIKLNVKDTEGQFVLEHTYTNLAETTFALITTGKIRIDSDASTFEWILMKGDNAVAVYIDTLDSKLTADETRKLDEVSFEMGFQEITDWTANTTNFDWLTLKVIPDEKLRSTISGFNFTINGKETVNRGLASDNLYLLPKEKNLTIPHDITVTPVLMDGSTEIKSLSQTVKAQPNIKLESIEFEGIDTSKVNELMLSPDTIEFQIKKNPENYTKFGEGEFEIAGDSVNFNMTEDGQVTVTPAKLGTTTLTYKEPGHNHISRSATFEVKLEQPTITRSFEQSKLRLDWTYVHPDCRVVLKETRNGVTLEDRVIKKKGETHNYVLIDIYKDTNSIYSIEVVYDENNKVESQNTIEMNAGNGFIPITITSIEDMALDFKTDLVLDKTYSMDESISFHTDPIEGITSYRWILNTSTVAIDKDYEFIGTKEKGNIRFGNEATVQTITLAVDTVDGRKFSKNIRFKLDTGVTK